VKTARPTQTRLETGGGAAAALLLLPPVLVASPPVRDLTRFSRGGSGALPGEGGVVVRVPSVNMLKGSRIPSSGEEGSELTGLEKQSPEVTMEPTG